MNTTEFSTQAKVARVLVVDDDPAMQRMIVSYLIDHIFMRPRSAGARA